MTKSRPWRMALAMFLSLSLALGFTQNAAAAPGKPPVTLEVMVSGEQSGGDTLRNQGDIIWVSVDSKGLDLSKKYRAAIQMIDGNKTLSAEEIGMGAVFDHQCQRITNSCTSSAKFPAYDKKLAGHTLIASIIIYDGAAVVAQDTSHSVKVPQNFEPIDPEAPKNSQDPSVPMPEQNDDANNPGQADQPAPPAIPVPPASDGAGSSSTGAIIGAVIGAVALIGIGVAFAASQAGKFLKFGR